jgi:hypothetical protein
MSRYGADGLGMALAPGDALAEAPPGRSTMSTILVVILILLLLGALPLWPYSSGCGFYPSGGLGILLLILIIVLLTGRL